MGWIRFGLAACLVVFIALAARAQTSLPVSDVDLERLDARLNRLVARQDMVGLAVAVVENGEVTFAKGYGVTHAGGYPVTENTVFRWASLSKGLAGSLAGLFVADGAFSFNDPIGHLSTSLKLPAAGEQRATVSDVLSHQLGIVPNAYDTRLEDGRDPDDIRTALGRLRVTCPVGDCHTYQNVAFDSITEVVERVGGASYSDLAREKIFEPLGMASATISRVGLFASETHARPHARRRGTIAPQQTTVSDYYYRVPAAGGVNSSILDLAQYMRAQMGLVPDVLPEPVLAAIQTPKVRTLREQRYINRRFGRMSDAHYGLGWRVYNYEDRRVVGHRGAVRGYRATILFDPEADAGIAVMWNSSARAPVGIQFEVMDMVYGLDPVDWMGIDAPTTTGG